MLMKSVTGKMVVSLVGVAVAAPFFVIALIAGARAVELAHNAQEDALLVVLAFSGAVISMINGFGRRPSKSARRESKRANTGEGAVSRGASTAKLSY